MPDVPITAPNMVDAQGRSVDVQKVIVVNPDGSFGTIPADKATGIAPVVGAFNGAGVSAEFDPVSGRDFNVTATGSGVVTLERKFTGDANWYVVLTDEMRKSLPPSITWNEPETGVTYRLNSASGTINYRISQ